MRKPSIIKGKPATKPSLKWRSVPTSYRSAARVAPQYAALNGQFRLARCLPSPRANAAPGCMACHPRKRTIASGSNSPAASNRHACVIDAAARSHSHMSGRRPHRGDGMRRRALMSADAEASSRNQHIIIYARYRSFFQSRARRRDDQPGPIRLYQQRASRSLNMTIKA